eukprot:c26467_g1_i1.p1 GENE.c26467_g1_i1~~c26467_g1_i1.p1  ORF type:complete len:220 (-),score=47.83 c26467_g1_i1:243-866(-)
MDDAGRLFRVRRTVLQMLRDRGYLVGERDIDMSIQDFKEIHTEAPSRERLTILVHKRDDPSDKLFVFFLENDDKDKKVGVQPVGTVLERMKTEQVNRSIIITENGLGAKAKSSIQEVQGKDFRIEEFLENHLLINITEHELVPKHTVLTDFEEKALLKRYGVKAQQLPRISVNDPVARYYGLRRSQIVKITRPSETAGRYVTYRLVD